ncbi:hypothetical protein DPMN_159573 [Dreissena polymorpha]|uniref:Uncharacterized protein n=1 Tax=Dreissena polymorpha TaxID=45954 RepID=A0A9D4IQU5_DREPO|nr:hypothetical protein DPMN_159573 [Dreissena polymorpha]
MRKTCCFLVNLNYLTVLQFSRDTGNGTTNGSGYWRQGGPSNCCVPGIHGSITPDALAKIPYIRLSSQMWGMIRFSKSDSLSVNVVDSENEGEEEELLDDKGVEAIERMEAVIANASLSGPPASYVNPPDAREDEQGARPKSLPPKVDARWQQVSVE